MGNPAKFLGFGSKGVDRLSAVLHLPVHGDGPLAELVNLLAEVIPPHLEMGELGLRTDLLRWSVHVTVWDRHDVFGLSSSESEEEAEDSDETLELSDSSSLEDVSVSLSLSLEADLLSSLVFCVTVGLEVISRTCS